MMEFDLIGYRYSPEELGLIADLLGYDGIDILHISVPGGIENAIARSSLENAGLLMEMDTEQGIDEVTALLAGSLCSAETYITVSGEGIDFVLLHPDGFYLMAQRIADGYVLKPARTADELIDEISDAMSGKTGITATLVKPGRTSVFVTDTGGILGLVKIL